MLNTDLCRRRPLHQCLPLSHHVERVVDEAHVDVDRVHPGDAVLDPDPVSGTNLVSVQLLQGGLGLGARLELDQTPVLDDAVLDGNLEWKIKIVYYIIDWAHVSKELQWVTIIHLSSSHFPSSSKCMHKHWLNDDVPFWNTQPDTSSMYYSTTRGLEGRQSKRKYSVSARRPSTN